MAAMKEIKYTVKKKITPRDLKVYEKQGLAEIEGDKFLMHLRKVLLDPEPLREVCAAVFEDDFSNTDMETVDVKQIREGILFFGENGLSLFRGLPKPAAS